MLLTAERIAGTPPATFRGSLTSGGEFSSGGCAEMFDDMLSRFDIGRSRCVICAGYGISPWLVDRTTIQERKLNAEIEQTIRIKQRWQLAYYRRFTGVRGTAGTVTFASRSL